MLDKNFAFAHRDIQERYVIWKLMNAYHRRVYMGVSAPTDWITIHVIAQTRFTPDQIVKHVGEIIARCLSFSFL